MRAEIVSGLLQLEVNENTRLLLVFWVTVPTDEAKLPAVEMPAVPAYHAVPEADWL